MQALTQGRPTETGRARLLPATVTDVPYSLSRAWKYNPKQEKLPGLPSPLVSTGAAMATGLYLMLSSFL